MPPSRSRGRSTWPRTHRVVIAEGSNRSPRRHWPSVTSFRMSEWASTTVSWPCSVSGSPTASGSRLWLHPCVVEEDPVVPGRLEVLHSLVDGEDRVHRIERYDRHVRLDVLLDLRPQPVTAGGVHLSGRRHEQLVQLGVAEVAEGRLALQDG